MIKTRLPIAVDLDGVLADFTGAVLELFNMESVLDSWPDGEYDIATVLDMPSELVWKKVEEAGIDFWAKLAPTTEYHQLLNLLEPYEWFILTSPTYDPFCAAGKTMWLKAHFGERFRNYAIVPAHLKQYLCQPGQILIDDNDGNCERWAAQGGRALLLPRPWNKQHKLQPQPVLQTFFMDDNIGVGF